MGDATVTVTGTTSQIGYALSRAAAVSFHPDTTAPTRAFRPYPRVRGLVDWSCGRPARAGVLQAGGQGWRQAASAFLTGAGTQVGWAAVGWRGW
jgi:hypothetical protein